MDLHATARRLLGTSTKAASRNPSLFARRRLGGVSFLFPISGTDPVLLWPCDPVCWRGSPVRFSLEERTLEALVGLAQRRVENPEAELGDLVFTLGLPEPGFVLEVERGGESEVAAYRDGAVALGGRAALSGFEEEPVSVVTEE